MEQTQSTTTSDSLADVGTISTAAAPPVSNSEGGEAVINPLETSRINEMVSDSEIFILNLKPSIWYILTGSLGSMFGVAFVVMLLSYLTTAQLPFVLPWTSIEIVIAGSVFVVVRIGWQALDWGARSYVLTDRRIIVQWGVIRRRSFQTTLFRIQHIAVLQSLRERILGLGTIAFATAGSATYDAAWLTVSAPFENHRIIVDAIDRYGGHHPTSDGV